MKGKELWRLFYACLADATRAEAALLDAEDLLKQAGQRVGLLDEQCAAGGLSDLPRKLEDHASDVADAMVACRRLRDVVEGLRGGFRTACKATLTVGALAMEVVSRQRLMEALDISARTLRRRSWPWVPVGTHAVNGKAKRGYLVEKLPPEVRAKLEQKGGQGHQPAPAESDGGPPSASETALAVRPSRAVGAAGPPPDELAGQVLLTPDGHVDLEGYRAIGLEGVADEFERRFRAVSKLRARLRNAGHGEKLAVRERTAAEFGVKPRTLRRWDDALAQWGHPAALVPGWEPHRGEFHAVPDELRARIEDAFLSQHAFEPARIYEDIVEVWGQQHGAVPSRKTVERVVNAIPEELRVLAREGRRAYDEKYVPRVTRDVTALAPHAWWCADFRKADTWIRVSDGRGRGWGKYGRLDCPCGSGKRRDECCSVVRPWWSPISDLATGGMVSFRVCVDHPNAQTVGLGLFEAMLAHGVPEHFYVDNGKSYHSNRIGKGADARLDDELDVEPDVRRSSMLAMLGVQVHSSIPYSSWSKPIESYFRWFAGEEKSLPGWCGNSPDGRPEKLEDELEDGRLLTLEQYCAAAEKMIARWNSHSIGDRERSPVDAWEGLDRPKPSPESLAFLLQKRGRRQVRRGAVMVDGVRFSDERFCTRLLDGERIEVRWNERDLSQTFAYLPGGECIRLEADEPAVFGTFSEANEQARHLAKVKRRAALERALQVKGSCPPGLLDRYGAFAAVELGPPEAGDGAEPKQLPEPVEAQLRARLEADEADEELYIDEYVRRLNARMGDSDRRRAGGRIEAPPERPSEPLDAIGVAKAADELQKAGYGEVGRGRWSAADLAVSLADGLGVSLGSRQPLEREKKAARVWARSALSTPAGQRALKAADARVLAVIEWGDGLPQGRGDIADLARWVRQTRDGREEDVPAGQTAAEDAVLALADLAERTWFGGVGVDAAIEVVGEHLEVLREARRDGLLADVPDELLTALVGVGLVAEGGSRGRREEAAA